MSSKINGIDGRSGPIGAGRAIQRTPHATAEKYGSAHEPTDVQITDRARQLAALEKALKDLPAVDEARVATIRLAIQNGTYQVSADDIASKLLQMEHALADLQGEK